MAITLGCLMVACSALADGANSGSNGINTNPGSGAGTQGAGGVVKFTGEITDVSCNVTSVTKDQTIDLGKWARSYFDSQEETTQTPFSIEVENCPTSVKKVAVFFDGDKDSSDNKLLQVTGGEGAATGIGIELYNEDKSTQIPVGSISKAVNVTQGSGEGNDGGSAKLNFYANYKADGSTVTTGKANGVTNFLMVYN